MTDKQQWQAVAATPIGRIGIRTRQGALTDIAFLTARHGILAPATSEAAEVLRQLRTYLTDGTAGFNFPIGLQGTPFQRSVWAVLQSIPSGVTRSYGDIARQLGSGARAVGNACRRNPCPIVVPCHRVVARTGIGGYSGANQGRMLDRKYWLLAHEGAVPGT